ncbi:MAG: hypothetical protein ABFS43_16620, partial [Thermodesulfobacteriota bacterium]
SLLQQEICRKGCFGTVVEIPFKWRIDGKLRGPTPDPAPYQSPGGSSCSGLKDGSHFGGCSGINEW